MLCSNVCYITKIWGVNVQLDILKSIDIMVWLIFNLTLMRNNKLHKIRLLILLSILVVHQSDSTLSFLTKVWPNVKDQMELIMSKRK